jgi:ABC-type lipoprotein release transport system permease subunit
LRSLLFGIAPADPLTLIAALALIVLTVLAGAYFPARRAVDVDPASALRTD